MANRIQGITVEIGGDTIKLATALKGVNSEIRNTQSQLKDVEKLLKLDPKNTELLAQKQKLLSQAIHETKEKLDALKAAQQQASEALAKGEITAQQYDALQREIIETEQALRELERQAEQSSSALQKIGETGEKLKTVGASIEEVGKKFLPVTGAVTGLGTLAVKTAADFDSSMSKVAAVSGATGKDLDALREKAREMGAKTKFSASEAAEAMNYMAMAGWKTGDMLEGVEGIMNLAAASGEGLATTSDIVTDALTALGMSASDSGHFADILADCRTAFSQMSESERAANAEAVVGKNAMSGFLAVMNAAPADIEKLNSAINNCDGTAESMAATMQDNLAGQLTILKSQLEELAISFGEILMPAIRQIVTWIQGFVEKLNGMDEGTKKVVVTIALLAAAIGPVLIVIGKVVGAIGTVMTVIPQIAAAISGVIAFVSGTVIPAIGAVVAAIGIVPLAIGAVIAIIILLWNKCEWFRDAVTDIWETIKTAAVTVWNAISEFLVGLWDGIVSVGQDIWNGLFSFFSGIWEGIKTVVSTVLQAVSTLITMQFEAYRTIITTVMNAIQNVITAVWNAVSNFISIVITGIQTFLTTAWNTIQTVISTAITAVQTVITTVWNAILSVIKTVMNTIQSVISSVWNGISSVITNVLNAIRTAVTNAFQAVVNGIKSAMSNVYNTVVSGFNEAVGFIKGLASSAFQWGADIIEGIVNGIKSCIGKVKDAVVNVADTIRSFLHFSVPDEGPLTDYESWMPDFMSGLAKGIEKSKGMVEKAVRGVAADMVVNPQVKPVNTMAAQQTETVNTISQMIGGFKDALNGIAEGSNTNISIPVYLGGTLLDEVVVNAQNRQNLRSGGR